MSEGRTYLDSIADIQDALQKVADFIEGMTFDEFANDDKTTFAVIRAFEVLGEAAKAVPDSIRWRYPEVPWREMSQMRDKLIHHYYGVNLAVVWKTATEQLPDLSPQMSIILRELTDEEQGTNEAEDEASA